MENFSELLIDLYLGSTQAPRKRITEETVSMSQADNKALSDSRIEARV